MRFPIVTVPVTATEPCVGITNPGAVAAHAYPRNATFLPTSMDSLLVASWLPATSVASNVRLVRPLVVKLGCADAALTVVDAMVCAPVAA